MQFLKADTLVKVVIGPVVAVGDGFTPITTLAVSTADEAEIMKHDAAAVTSISGNTFAAITSADGYYNLTITAAQLGTEGMLTVLINDDSLCLPVRHDFMVVNANVYDSLYAPATTDYLQVDTIQVAGATEDIATETKQNTAQTDLDIITGTDGVILGAAGVDLVWDEVLTGATHNVPTSAGRRLRGIQDFQGYENGAIWIDTVNGSAGTTDYENGTVENPVLTLADALTLNASLGFNRFTVFNGSNITLTSTFNNYLFIGQNWTLALGGQDIGGSHFHGATVTGIGTGAEATFVNSHIGNTTLDLLHFNGCALSGTVTIAAAGDQFMDNCHSAIAGTATPIIDSGAAIANSNINIRHYSGGIELQNLGQTGTDTVSVEGDGQVILNASCVGGSINIRGNFELTDNSATTTINDDARYDAPRHVDLTWDENISKANHNTTQSAAKLLRQGADLVQIDGAVTDASPGVGGFDTNLTQMDTYFDDSVLIFSNGSANAGIGITVSSYVNANGRMTFNAPDQWPVTPVNGDDFVIYATHVHPISQIADGVLDEALSGHATAGTLGKAVTDIETDAAAILVDTGTTLPATLGSPSGADMSADIADLPTVVEFEARTSSASQLAYINAHAATAVPVTFSAGSTTTATLTSGTGVDGGAPSSVNDYYNGRVLIFNAGTLDQQATDITDYDGSTGILTITALTTAVTGSHTAIMV